MNLQENLRNIYSTARSSAAWMANSEFSFFAMVGNDSLDLLQRITSNDLRSLQVEQGCQTVLLTDKGRIFDVLLPLREQQRLLVLCSAPAQREVISFLKRYIIMEDIRIRPLQDELHAFHVLGPSSAVALGEMTGEDVQNLRVGNSLSATLFDIPVRIIKLPPIAEVQYLVLCSAEHASVLQSNFAAVGDHFPELTPEIFDILRIEAGQGRYGQEFSDSYNPFEAGLLGTVNLKKGCFVGQEVLARLDTYNKVQKHLIGVTSNEQFSPQWHVFSEGKAVGLVTSAAFSPEMNCYIGMAIIRNEYANFGTEVGLSSGNEAPEILGTLQKLPLLQ